jgi:hypothetical protein
MGAIGYFHATRGIWHEKWWNRDPRPLAGGSGTIDQGAHALFRHGGQIVDVYGAAGSFIGWVVEHSV